MAAKVQSAVGGMGDRGKGDVRAAARIDAPYTARRTETQCWTVSDRVSIRKAFARDRLVKCTISLGDANASG